MKNNSAKHNMIYLISNSDFTHENGEIYSQISRIKVAQISYLKFELDLSEFDALIITSANAVRAMAANGVRPAPIEVYAIGAKSAAACEEFGFSQIYTAQNSHSSDFLREISPLIAACRVVFVGAREKISDFSGLDCTLTQIAAYENKFVPQDISKKPKNGAILIFTSPKNVEYFVRNFGWDNSWQAVAIGRSTAAFLSKFTSPEISQIQSIDECIKIAINLQNKI